MAHFYAYGLIGPPKVDLALRYANLALLQEQEKASAKISEYEQLLLGPPNEKVPSSENNQLDKVPSPLAPSMVEAPPLPPEPEPLQEPQTFKPIANILPSVYSTEEKIFHRNLHHYLKIMHQPRVRILFRLSLQHQLMKKKIQIFPILYHLQNSIILEEGWLRITIEHFTYLPIVQKVVTRKQPAIWVSCI